MKPSTSIRSLRASGAPFDPPANWSRAALGAVHRRNLPKGTPAPGAARLQFIFGVAALVFTLFPQTSAAQVEDLTFGV